MFWFQFLIQLYFPFQDLHKKMVLTILLKQKHAFILYFLLHLFAYHSDLKALVRLLLSYDVNNS
mgnify:CR=1 FL=1